MAQILKKLENQRDPESSFGHQEFFWTKDQFPRIRSNSPPSLSSIKTKYLPHRLVRSHPPSFSSNINHLASDLPLVWIDLVSRHTALSLSQSLASLCRFSEVRVSGRRRRSLSLSLPTHWWDTNQSNQGLCLAHLSSVLSVQPSVARLALSRPPRLLNDLARGIMQSGASRTEPFSQSGLTGKGQIVGMSDTGIDLNSCFFHDNVHGRTPSCSWEHPSVDLKYRKVVQYVNFSGSSGDVMSGHGSHVAGIIAGSVAPENLPSAASAYNGMAPDAKLAIFDIQNPAYNYLFVPDDLALIFKPAYAAGARLHSNSWGGGFWYDEFCIEVDKFLFDHPDFLAIFAAGNEGSRGLETILSPGLSKNALAVAASETGHSPGQNIGTIASFSSTGPAPDGRTKPDITAPGSSIISASARDESLKSVTCSTTTKAGTSMACPVAAGNTALIRQYFTDPSFWANYCNSSYPLCHGGSFSPSGPLVKALVLHSGTPMTVYSGSGSVGRVSLSSGPPDNFQGYGRLTLSNILPLSPPSPSSFSLFIDELLFAPLTEAIYEVHVLDGSSPLIATICWFDPPSEPFVARLLQHDLDLIVEGPGGIFLYGNAKPGSNSRDELNPNERARVVNPAVGIWKVRVQSKFLSDSFPAPSQRVSVVITAIGWVQGPGVHHQLSSLTLEALRESQCQGGQNSTQRITLSLWSMIQSDGWSSGDKYSISPIPTASSTASQAGPEAFGGGFSKGFAYSSQDLCLSSDCYLASLSLDPNTNHEGTQFEISQCDVFLSPLSPSRRFCLSPPLSNPLSPSAFVPGKCISDCLLGPHLSLSTLMGEASGGGWFGGYVSAHRVDQPFLSMLLSQKPLSSPPPQLSLWPSISETLEWGFELTRSLCLPLDPSPNHTCFLFQLSFDPETETLPYLYFLNSSQASDPCPLALDWNTSMASLCLVDSNQAQLSFYSRPLDQLPFGLSRTDSLGLVQQWQQPDLSFSGSCSVEISLDLPSSPPTSSPTQTPLPPTSPPSSQPSTSSSFPPSSLPFTAPPSLSPTLLPSSLPSQPETVPHSTLPSPAPSPLPSSSPSYRFLLTSELFGPQTSCFLSCLPLSLPFLSHSLRNQSHAWSLEELAVLCGVLSDSAFPSCSSDSLSEGTCPRPTCASDCPTREWCEMGVKVLRRCPPSRLSSWISESLHSSPDSDLNSSCVSHTLSSSSSEESTKSPSPTLTLPEFLAAFLLGEIFYIMIPSQSQSLSHLSSLSISIVCLFLLYCSYKRGTRPPSPVSPSPPPPGPQSSLSSSAPSSSLLRWLVGEGGRGGSGFSPLALESEHKSHPPEDDVPPSPSPSPHNPMHNPPSMEEETVIELGLWRQGDQN